MLLAGFGGGMAVGAAVLRWHTTGLAPWGWHHGAGTTGER
ncbi:MAG TPA: hypothetical protein VFR35_20720 [Actinoplanes sp.]|nr:hypothetical protein [Actinoplanes sp.]